MDSVEKSGAVMWSTTMILFRVPLRIVFALPTLIQQLKQKEEADEILLGDILDVCLWLFFFLESPLHFIFEVVTENAFFKPPSTMGT